jgi:putative acetyltransferase
MTIRSARSDERETLVDIWLRSVRATHHFLSEDDIGLLLPHVREALRSDELETWTLAGEDGVARGFMILSPGRLEALFLAPEHRGRGAGRAMVEHALARGAVAVDVNEQNPDALRFYERCGFVIDGRSEVDGMGMPFPLLHMRHGAAR